MVEVENSEPGKNDPDSRQIQSDVRAPINFSKRLLNKCSEQPIAVLALLVSFLAFLVSFGGFYTSRQALRQTLTQYAEERAIVLTARFGEKTDSLVIATTDVRFHFLGGLIEFPSSVFKVPLQIQEDGAVWGMGSLDSELNNFIQRNYPTDAEHILILELGIPIVISSSYTTKGRRYFDNSLYESKYFATISDNKLRPVSAKFNGFAFVPHFGSADVLPNLDELLRRAMSRTK